MNTEKSYHVMSDSSSDEDIELPLAQRLGRGVSTKPHISPVNVSYKRDDPVSTDCISTTAKSSERCQKFDKTMEVEEDGSSKDIAWRSDSKHANKKLRSAHSMSDNYESDTLPNIIAPKLSSIKSKRVNKRSATEKQKKLEEKKKTQEAKKLQREEERRLKDIEAKRKRIEKEQRKALSKNECLKVSLLSEYFMNNFEVLVFL